MEGKDRPLVPWISLGILTLAVLAAGGWILLRSPPPDPVDESALLKQAEALAKEGDAAYAALNRARRDGDSAGVERERARALSAYDRAMQRYESVLSRYRDADGVLRPNYQGYEEPVRHLALRMSDLRRG